jgi:hypothetical protein
MALCCRSRQRRRLALADAAIPSEKSCGGSSGRGRRADKSPTGAGPDANLNGGAPSAQRAHLAVAAAALQSLF